MVRMAIEDWSQSDWLTPPFGLTNKSVRIQSLNNESTISSLVLVLCLCVDSFKDWRYAHTHSTVSTHVVKD
jgi:hypothetical protein